jgi:3'(2'),5'-bisphosphate nucleotidase
MPVDTKNHLSELLALVNEADAAVMKRYRSEDNTVEYKTDNSPLTKADLAAHQIIFQGLRKLFPDLPVISEEGDPAENKKNLSAEAFWLVDPLDGTQEFVNKQTGDFAVCLGLVEDGVPTFGIVSTPAHGQTYYGGPGIGSYRITEGQPAQPIRSESRDRIIWFTAKVFKNCRRSGRRLSKIQPYYGTLGSSCGPGDCGWCWWKNRSSRRQLVKLSK